MNVFSPRSFLMPLLDKKNLITIILVAVFFGFYRVAGGRVYTQPRTGAPKKVTTTEIISPFGDDIPDVKSLNPADDIKKLGTNGLTPPRGKRDTLNELLGSESGKNQQNTGAKAPDNKPSGDSKLDDIERRLGLR